MTVELKCKICGSKNHKMVRDNLRYGVNRMVMQCTDCKFEYLEPLENVGQEYYSGKEYRKNYGPTLGKVSNCREIFDTYLPYQEKIFNEIKEIVSVDMKMLDVGCSTGHFLTYMKDKVAMRIGLELSQDEVNFINDNLDFKVYSNPIETLNIEEGPFDLITSLQVLEHIDDPLTFLKNIAKNLKDDGYLYLELPNLNDTILKYYKIPGYADFYYREPHVSYFSKETLGSLLKQAGFIGEIKNVQRYNFMNHMNWFLTGKPQSSYVLGNSEVKLMDNDINDSVRADFNDFIRKVDADYKQLIQKHFMGESLTFLGKKA